MTQKFLVSSKNLKQQIGMCDVTKDFLHMFNDRI